MDLLQFLFFCLCTSLWCVGVNRVMFHEDILDWYSNLIHKLPDWLYNPLGGCVSCMSSIHSVFWWFALGYGFDVRLILCIPIVYIFNNIIYNYMESLDE